MDILSSEDGKGSAKPFTYHDYQESLCLPGKERRSCHEVEHKKRYEKGKVIEVKEGTVAAKVRVDIGGGNIITSDDTVDAVRDLALKTGDEVCALIKASNVMIMKE